MVGSIVDYLPSVIRAKFGFFIFAQRCAAVARRARAGSTQADSGLGSRSKQAQRSWRPLGCMHGGHHAGGGTHDAAWERARAAPAGCSSLAQPATAVASQQAAIRQPPKEAPPLAWSRCWSPVRAHACGPGGSSWARPWGVDTSAKRSAAREARAAKKILSLEDSKHCKNAARVLATARRSGASRRRSGRFALRARVERASRGNKPRASRASLGRHLPKMRLFLPPGGYATRLDEYEFFFDSVRCICFTPCCEAAPRRARCEPRLGRRATDAGG